VDSTPYRQEQPNSVQIEFVQGCPLMCSFCGLNGIMARGVYEYMSETTLRRVVESIKNAGWTSRIELAMHGEPTVHPMCSAFVQIIREALPKSYIMMLTNGYGLRKNAPFRIGELFASGLNCLGIERYEGCVWAGEIEEQLRQAKADKYLMNYPACGPDGNPHHRSMKARVVFIGAIDKATDCTHASLCNHCGAAAPLNDQLAGKRCARPFREMSVRWDGWVALCCNDFRGEYRVGNLNEQSVEEVWQHERFHAARLRLYQGQRDFVPCRGCDHRSYRSGLLPDKCGKATLPMPDGTEAQALQDAVAQGPLAKVVKRPWEE